MKYKLMLTNNARKELKKLPVLIQDRIREKLNTLCMHGDTSILDIKRIKGYEGYRLRVRDYRIIYRKDNNTLTVVVIKVRHRKRAYH